MSRGQSGSYVESGSRRSSRGSTWRERRQKRREDGEYKEQGQSGLREGSFQTYRTMSGTSGRTRFNRRDQELKQKDKELKCLCRLVRDLELEARGRHRRRDHEDRGEWSASVEDHCGAGSHQSGSHRHWDRSREYVDQDLISPKDRQPRNAAMDTMSRTLH